LHWLVSLCDDVVSLACGVPCAPEPCVSPLFVLQVAVLPPLPFAPRPFWVWSHW